MSSARGRPFTRFYGELGHTEGVESSPLPPPPGADLFQQASGDIRQIQMFLDHAHLNTTQIYLEQLTGEEHRHWQAMANRLGV